MSGGQVLKTFNVTPWRMSIGRGKTVARHNGKAGEASVGEAKGRANGKETGQEQKKNRQEHNEQQEE